MDVVFVVPFLIALTFARLGLAFAEKAAESLHPRWRAAGEILESLTIAVVIIFLVVRPFVVQAFYIPSESMTPTLMQNDWILVDKLSYRMGRPQRHEVVVFRAPKEALHGEQTEEEQDFVKRVIGLPGDVVEISSGVTYVNGEPQNEPYTCEAPGYDLSPYTVPPGKLFVMGDNRNHSNDSHRWGALDCNRLIGRAVLIFWPPGRIGTIR